MGQARVITDDLATTVQTIQNSYTALVRTAKYRTILFLRRTWFTGETPDEQFTGYDFIKAFAILFAILTLMSIALLLFA